MPTEDAGWQELFDRPHLYFDKRARKTNPKAPDFAAKSGTHSLWLDSDSKPDWVDARLPELYSRQVRHFLPSIADLCSRLDIFFSTLHTRSTITNNKAIFFPALQTRQQLRKKTKQILFHVEIFPSFIKIQLEDSQHHRHVSCIGKATLGSRQDLGDGQCMLWSYMTCRDHVDTAI